MGLIEIHVYMYETVKRINERYSKKKKNKEGEEEKTVLNVVANACHLCTPEAKVGEFLLRAQAGLPNEFRPAWVHSS